MENIILKATAKDRFYRYESVDAMGEDIRTALDPDRINEPPFVIPEDQDATKAIPVITKEQLQSTDETIIRKPEKQTLVYEKETSDLPNNRVQNKNHDKQEKQKDNKNEKRACHFSIFLYSFVSTRFLKHCSIPSHYLERKK